MVSGLRLDQRAADELSDYLRFTWIAAYGRMMFTATNRNNKPETFRRELGYPGPELGRIERGGFDYIILEWEGRFRPLRVGDSFTISVPTRITVS